MLGASNPTQGTYRLNHNVDSKVVKKHHLLKEWDKSVMVSVWLETNSQNICMVLLGWQFGLFEFESKVPHII